MSAICFTCNLGPTSKFGDQWFIREGAKLNKNYFTGAEAINKFLNFTTTQGWNKALWLDDPSHATSFNQSECFISE